MLSIIDTAPRLGQGAAVTAPRTARAQARVELTASIKQVAGRHLAEHGAAGLSLRAVARDLGLASSAVYRYFASRDALLTALIIEAYDDLGASVERAESTVIRADLARRWLETGRAIRRWGLAHPQRYGLLYGAPVPGYKAPQDTIGPAQRTTDVFLAILRDAASAQISGLSAEPGDHTLPDAITADLTPLADDYFGGLAPHVIARSIVAWTSVFGLVSFELNGQFQNVIEHRDAFFDHAIVGLGRSVGLPSGEA